MDATFVEVPRQRNPSALSRFDRLKALSLPRGSWPKGTRAQNAQIKAGEIPPAFAEDAKWRAHKDTDARWAMKDFKPCYGSKNHCRVDVADKPLGRLGALPFDRLRP